MSKENTKDQLAKLVYREGELDDYQNEQDFKIMLFDYDLEEERDQKSVDVAMVRYKEAIRFLFRKYSHSTSYIAKGQQEQNFIYFVDIWKFCTENSIQLLVQKEEVHQIVKLVNLKFMQQKKLDSYTLDLEVFPEFVVQLAYKCYSRRPQDLRGQYVGLMVDALFNLVASSMKQRNENPNIILDPDQLFVRGDVRLIKELNYQLMEDPEMEIPPDYAKYKSKDLFVDYRLGEEIQAAVGGAYATCYELLADILHEQLE